MSASDAMHDIAEFVNTKSNLKTCCAGYLKFKETGLMPGGKYDALVAKCNKVVMGHGHQLADSVLLEAASRLIATGRM